MLFVVMLHVLMLYVRKLAIPHSLDSSARDLQNRGVNITKDSENIL